MTAELARHIGHQCRLLDTTRLRCDECTQTVLLSALAGSTSTSSSAIPGPGEPRCPTHEHEHRSSCRPCAADAKVNPDADTHHGHTSVVHQPTADVTARVAEARAVLPPKLAAPRRTPVDDPVRMAAARAELDALRPQPEPDPAGAT